MGRHEWGQNPLLRPPESAAGIDVDKPNIARMYDYYLGGSAHFAVDRIAAEQFRQALPGNPRLTDRYTRGNRSFLGRAVTLLCQQGIDQFLDLGSGVPTVGNVHEIAHRHDPTAHVAYVDREPVAVAHARRLLGDNSRVSVTQADIRRPDEVLTAPEVTKLLDFTRPVAILAVAILDLLDDADDPAGLIATYRDACVPGSALVISHAVQDAATDQQVRAVQDLMGQTNTPRMLFRTPDDIAGFFAGYAVLDPGVARLDQRRPEGPVSDEQAAEANGYGAVGILRSE